MQNQAMGYSEGFQPFTENYRLSSVSGPSSHIHDFV